MKKPYTPQKLPTASAYRGKRKAGYKMDILAFAENHERGGPGSCMR